MKTAILAAAAIAATACGARTAYTADRTQSYLCIPNPQVQNVPFGEPLAVTNEAKTAPAVAAK